MSEGIQKAGGGQFRKVLDLMTHNRFLGVLSGFFLTALLQSSSATTVMTVSFVNAGLLSLVESAGIIMGANIGTTITAWIISVLGFQVKLHTLSVPIFAIAVPLLFIKKGKIRFWGEFLIGFALLFLGLNFLKESIEIQSDSALLVALSDYASSGWLSGLLFMVIGLIIAIILQSSSAAMALILVIAANGLVSLEVAATMILGMNIGTTVTAEVASLVGNVFAKRAARIHSLFNILGACWMFLVLPIFLVFLDNGLQSIFYSQSAFSNSANTPIALSAFHTVFNVLNTLILIIPINWLVGLAVKTVKSKGEEDEIRRLSYIDSYFSTPELSILEVQRKVGHFGEIIGRMSGFSKKLLFSIHSEEQNQMLEKINQYKNIANRIQLEYSDFLIKISKKQVTPNTSQKIQGLLDSCGELERIANIFYQIGKSIERKRSEKIWFNQHQRNQLEKMFVLIDEAFVVMNKNLVATSASNTYLTEAKNIELQINTQRDIMRKESAMSKESQDYNVYSTMIYSNIFSALERIGDHIEEVTKVIWGEI